MLRAMSWPVGGFSKAFMFPSGNVMCTMLSLLDLNLKSDFF
jgi:hypothetical protein